MDLHELITELNDPEDDRKRAAVQARVRELRGRVALDPRSVTNAELIQGIEDLFGLDSSPGWLKEADWLMDTLAFTCTPITPRDVPTAWAAFQADKGFELDYWDYPILEAISFWYFEHKDDPRYSEIQMVARCAAVLEYLFARVRGREADDEYSDILAGNGLTILSLYWGLKDYERVKFYANLLDLEYRAGRLGEEQYLTSLQFHEECLLREKEPSVTTTHAELHKINESLIKLLSDTWTDRESKIDELAKANAKLYEELARQKDSTYPELARRELSTLFGTDWNRLAPETRSHLERGLTFLQEHYAAHSPTAAPDAFFMAVKVEVLTRLFKPLGLLEEEILKRANTKNPLKLLLSYGGHRGAMPLTKQDRELIRTAFQNAGSKAGLLSQTVLVGLQRLADDRDRIAHQEGRQSRPYTFEDLQRCKSEVWTKGWLIPFLKGIHSTEQNGPTAA